MLAAVFAGAGQPLSIERIDDPQPLPSDLILRVKSCGICGSDLHMTDAHSVHVIPGGSIMGHEFAGEVVAVGTGLTGQFREGQRLVGFPWLRCGRCPACRRGDDAYGACAAGEAVGTGQRAGGFAEYVRIDAATAHILPDNVSFDEGALVEPLAVGLHAVDAAGPIRGATVLIVGAGPVGLAVILWARALGARDVIVSEFSQTRRRAAAACGATAAIDPSQPLDTQIRQAAGRDADILFDCVGIPGLLQTLFETAPRGGSIIVAGACMQRDSFLPIAAMVKELNIKFVLGYRPRDFDYVIEMIARDRIDVAHLISDHVTLEGLPAAFEALRKPIHQNKVIINP